MQITTMKMAYEKDRNIIYINNIDRNIIYINNNDNSNNNYNGNNTKNNINVDKEIFQWVEWTFFIGLTIFLLVG